MRRTHAAYFLGSLTLAVAAACGSSSGSSFNDDGHTNGDGGASSSGLPNGFGSSGEGGLNNGEGSVNSGPIAIDPTDQVVTINAGDALPTVQFHATLQSTGASVPAAWSVDRGEIGTIGLTSGLFTAGGTTAGTAKVTATYLGATATTTITIKINVTQNGASAAQADAGGGAGGNGGVGGSPAGGSIDNTMIGVLHGAAQTDPGLTTLYPYDGTVWPRGILPPLLQWQPGAQGSYEAVDIQLSEASFTYEGFFAASGSPFQNVPIDPAAWNQLLTSNQGEDVNVTITLAKGGVAYGPLKMTWKVASAPLKGVVYYNSYGTNLAHNYPGAVTPTGTTTFGAATLAVHGDSTDPVLVAGKDGDETQCRVCHSVAANGSVLITQRDTGDKREFSTYDLKQAYPGGETMMTPSGTNDAGIDIAPWAWSAIYPDGTMFFNDSSTGAGSTGATAGQPGNQLWGTVSGAGPATPASLPMNGWPAGLRGAYPAFSPDGKSIAFTTFQNGNLVDPAAIDMRSLAYAPFDKTTNTFGTPTLLYTPPQPPAGTTYNNQDPSTSPHTALYPAFLPTNDGVIFEHETVYNGRDYGGTRSQADTNGSDKNGPNATLIYQRDHGAHGELWWTSVTSPAPVRLDRLNGYNNGTSYLPHGPAGSGHEAGNEETLNYEPTVNPVASGGYAWVVFTSRRLYGNVATINPHWSDPRFHDLTSTPTPKKLWVAAIDLNAQPGTDPSHPAFYLPAQELLAGNSRGYWVVDPCKSDGSSCGSGDECCGGYCRPNGDGGALVCSNVTPTCAQEYEKCSTASDCCDTTNQCINNRCAQPGSVK